MFIGKISREVTMEEQLVINNVFEQLKKSFPEIQIVEKKDIVGIGEPNKHLLCYFSDNDGLKVKFKSEEKSMDAYEDLSLQIQNTINLFLTQDFSLKLPKKEKTINQNIEDENGIENRESEEFLKILSQEEILFFKILLNDIDPKTGEKMGFCEDSLSILKQIYNKIINAKSVVIVKSIRVTKKEKLIIDEFFNGESLLNLCQKYNLKQNKIKRIICKSGITKRTVFVCNTYEETLTKIEKNKHKENVGIRWSEDEDHQLINEYMSGIAIRDIAKIHRRLTGGIKSRLVKHGFAENRRDLPQVYKG